MWRLVIFWLPALLCSPPVVVETISPAEDPEPAITLTSREVLFFFLTHDGAGMCAVDNARLLYRNTETVFFRYQNGVSSSLGVLLDQALPYS